VRQADLEALARSDKGQRVEDVVAVSDEGDDEAVKAPEHLGEGEHVGERLAGMLAQGEGVDDRDRRCRRELLGDRVGTGPDDDRVDEAIKIAARHPGQRFGGVEIRPVFELAGLPQGG
jgi:hypothetical protein